MSRSVGVLNAPFSEAIGLIAKRPTSGLGCPYAASPMLWKPLSVKFGAEWQAAQLPLAGSVKRRKPRICDAFIAFLSPRSQWSNGESALIGVSSEEAMAF